MYPVPSNTVRRRGARTALAVLAGAVALAACSVSTDDAATTDAPTTTETSATEDTTPATEAPVDSSPVDTADATSTTEAPVDTTPMIPVRGVTDDTIKLGLAPIDADAVREQFGVDLGYLPEGAIEALVEGTNQAGGINGRQIEIVTHPFLPVGTESAEEACRVLIEDEEVYAVLGMFLGDGGLCVTETYETPYIALFGLNEERKARSVAPFIAMEGDALGASVQEAIDSGVLDGKKVAIYTESDVAPEIVENDVTPALEAAGIEVVSTAQLPSSGDTVQAANDIDVIFQRFQADGADALLSLAGAAVLLPALERTEWAPQLVFTNGQVTGDGGLANFGLTDFSELEGSVAVTMSLLSDDVAVDEKFLECIATINEYAGTDVTPTDIYDPGQKPESRQYGQLPGLCQLWDVAVAVLTGLGNDLSNETIIPALDKVGEFPITGYDHAEITSTRWGAVDSVRLWSFDAEAQRFVPQAG